MARVGTGGGWQALAGRPKLASGKPCGQAFQSLARLQGLTPPLVAGVPHPTLRRGPHLPPDPSCAAIPTFFGCTLPRLRAPRALRATRSCWWTTAPTRCSPRCSARASSSTSARSWTCSAASLQASRTCTARRRHSHTGVARQLLAPAQELPAMLRPAQGRPLVTLPAPNSLPPLPRHAHLAPCHHHYHCTPRHQGPQGGECADGRRRVLGVVRLWQRDQPRQGVHRRSRARGRGRDHPEAHDPSLSRARGATGEQPPAGCCALTVVHRLCGTCACWLAALPPPLYGRSKKHQRVRRLSSCRCGTWGCRGSWWTPRLTSG